MSPWKFDLNDGRATAEKHNGFLNSHLDRNPVINTLYKQETQVLLDPCAHQLLHLQGATMALRYVHGMWHSSF